MLPNLGKASPPFMFPTYLLPSLSFRRRKPSTDSDTSTSSTESSGFINRSDTFVQGHRSHLRCVRCAADLCLTSQIISKGFTGRHGRAYLVSGPPVSSSTSETVSLPNTHVHKAVPRQLVTGAHTVSDVSCAFCGTLLGWKYVAAEEEPQKYKVGKFILETKKICSFTCWENEGTNDEAGGVTSETPPVTAEGFRSNDDPVEFDSQDEDECEDLFAGVWTPASAIKRRRGKQFDRTTGK